MAFSCSCAPLRARSHPHPPQGSLSLHVNVSGRYSDIRLSMNGNTNASLCNTYLGAPPSANNAWTMTTEGCNYIFHFTLNWTLATRFCGIRQVPSGDPNFVDMRGTTATVYFY